LAIEDKYEDDINKLIEAGKEKGYLTYNEVNDLIPGDLHSPDDLDDLLTTIGTQGIDVLEGGPKFGADKFESEGEEGEDVELDLTPGTLEKTNDPVRMYLREMGTVPLLTREGEVEIAKRIERGQLRVLKAISRSPIVIREVVALGEDLKRGVRNIKEVVIFDRPGRHAAEAPEKGPASVRKAGDNQPQGEGERPSQDALDDEPRAGGSFPHCARTEIHQRGTQTSAG
jgi:RNA polymerase primary sigma factor